MIAFSITKKAATVAAWTGYQNCSAALGGVGRRVGGSTGEIPRTGCQSEQSMANCACNMPPLGLALPLGAYPDIHIIRI